MNSTDLAEHLSRLTTWHPPRAMLEVVELLVTAALPPAPLPVGPEAAAAVERDGGLVVEDAEGTPVAVLTQARRIGEDTVDGVLTAARAFTHGPVRRHRRTPGEVAEMLDLLGPGQVLAVPVDGTLSQVQVDEVSTLAAHEGARVLWLVLVGAGRRRDLPAEALLRAVRDAASDLRDAGVASVAVPVALPLWSPDRPGATSDAALVAALGHAHGADVVLPLRAPTTTGAGAALHPASAREADRALRPAHRRGVTVFFTGLSGSGKSTVAKALAERLLDDGRRDLTMLDGDEVRRLLSAGLGFGRADRDLNIRRIGYVAAEVTRHGGLAVCAPIAPFASVRAEVREMVSEAGDFLLVHVSTPLAECERRDRKGLYAKARQGLIPEFTGISSPYEEPTDADLSLDTSTMSVDEAVDQVWALIEARGYLGPLDPRH